MFQQNTRLLSGNALKIIAAVAMVLDHAGLMFFPGNKVLRILGRLAFPIFAFMIAEGCKYTRNRLRYFLQLFILAAVCQIVYFLVDGSMYLSILFTFSSSLLMIFSLQHWKEQPSAGRAVLFLVVLGIVQLGIPYVLFAKASSLISPLSCSLLGMIEPLLNPVWVALFYGEIPGIFALTGGIIVLGAVIFYNIWDEKYSKS